MLLCVVFQLACSEAVSPLGVSSYPHAPSAHAGTSPIGHDTWRQETSFPPLTAAFVFISSPASFELSTKNYMCLWGAMDAVYMQTCWMIESAGCCAPPLIHISFFLPSHPHTTYIKRCKKKCTCPLYSFHFPGDDEAKIRGVELQKLRIRV